MTTILLIPILRGRSVGNILYDTDGTTHDAMRRQKKNKRDKNTNAIKIYIPLQAYFSFLVQYDWTTGVDTRFRQRYGIPCHNFCSSLTSM